MNWAYVPYIFKKFLTSITWQLTWCKIEDKILKWLMKDMVSSKPDLQGMHFKQDC